MPDRKLSLRRDWYSWRVGIVDKVLPSSSIHNSLQSFWIRSRLNLQLWYSPLRKFQTWIHPPLYHHCQVHRLNPLVFKLSLWAKPSNASTLPLSSNFWRQRSSGASQIHQSIIWSDRLWRIGQRGIIILDGGLGRSGNCDVECASFARDDLQGVQITVWAN